MGLMHQEFPNSPLVDIVVLIAGDTSMQAVADAFQMDGGTALHDGATTCPSDVNLVVLTVGTNAFPSYYASPTFPTYVTDVLNDTNAVFKERTSAAPNNATIADYDLENAVIDAVQYYNWRDSATKSIIVFGNQWPDGGGTTKPQAASTAGATAIANAKAKGITLYAYLTPPASSITLDATVLAEYQALATGVSDKTTVDMSKLSADDVKAAIVKILQTDICASTPSTGTQTGGTSCGTVCDSFSSILCTINLLACALNKAMDACCPGAGANTGCDCGCTKTMPPPLNTASKPAEMIGALGVLPKQH